MSLASLLTEPIEHVRAYTSAKDEYGTPRVVHAPPTWLFGRLEQVSADESVVDSDQQRTQWRLFLAPTVVVMPQDRFTARGMTFETDGEPISHRTPAGAHHIECRLRKVTG